MPPLRDYQQFTVDQCLERKFDYTMLPMGMGKTRIMIETVKAQGKRAMVVAPLLVALDTWPREVKKWWPEATVGLLHGVAKDEIYKMDTTFKIINFDGLKWFIEKVRQHGSRHLKDRVLIIDEATDISSVKSVRFQALKALRHFFSTSSIFALSATPLTRGYEGVWAPYYMIDGGKALGTKTNYIESYFIVSGPPRWESTLIPGNDKIIQDKVKHMTTILKAEDWLDMPKVQYNNVYVELPSRVMEVYKKLKKEYVLKYWSDNYEDEELVIQSKNAGVNTGRLRQLVQGALYDDIGYTVFHTMKIEMLRQLVKEAQGDPILCPICFKFELEELKKAFPGVPSITGQTHTKEKLSILERWNNKELPLLLGHPSSIGRGLNLQFGGRYIVWYHLPWDLELYLQLNGRLIRPGQEKSVVITNIVAKGTVDDRVAEVLANKDATQRDFLDALRSYFKE